jgi:hypothetical protein
MRAELPPGDRIVILVSLVLAGIALSSLTRFPTISLQADAFGTPVGLDLSGRWILTALLVLLAMVGTDAIVRAEAGRARIDPRYTATFWILPGLITLAAAFGLPQLFGAPLRWLPSTLLLGTLLALVIDAEYRTLHVGGPYYRTARLGLNMATYLAAFALFAALYGLELRSLLSAPLVAAFGFPLALELLRGTEEQLETTWLYAGVVALVLGELTWALNLWGLRALAGGGLLLLAFYTLTGLAQQHLAGRLNRRVILEYGLTAVIGLAALLAASPLGF